MNLFCLVFHAKHKCNRLKCNPSIFHADHKSNELKCNEVWFEVFNMLLENENPIVQRFPSSQCRWEFIFTFTFTFTFDVLDCVFILILRYSDDNTWFKCSTLSLSNNFYFHCFLSFLFYM